jgi:hypothetical protein
LKRTLTKATACFNAGHLWFLVKYQRQPGASHLGVGRTLTVDHNLSHRAILAERGLAFQRRDATPTSFLATGRRKV